MRTTVLPVVQALLPGWGSGRVAGRCFGRGGGEGQGNACLRDVDGKQRRRREFGRPGTDGAHRAVGAVRLGVCVVVRVLRRFDVRAFANPASTLDQWRHSHNALRNEQQERYEGTPILVEASEGAHSSLIYGQVQENA